MNALRNLLAVALNAPGHCEHLGAESCDQWWRADAARAAFTEWLRSDETRRVVADSLRVWFMATDQNSEPVWLGGAEKVLAALAAAVNEGTTS